MWLENQSGVLSEPISTESTRIQHPDHLIDAYLRGFHIFFTSVTTVLIFAGNGLMVLTILCTRCLHCPQGVLLLSLAFADLLIGVESLLGFVATVTGQWPTPPVGCTVVGYATEVAVAVNLLTIALMAVDRWLVVHKPFRYQHYVTLRRAAATVLAVWLLSFALYCPFFFSCLEFEYERQTFMCSLEVKRCRALVITLVTFVRVPGLIVVVTFTMMTCRTAQIHVRSIQASEQVTLRTRDGSKDSLNFSPTKHVRTTLAVILTFIITSLPMYILQMCSTIDPSFQTYNAVIFVASWLLVSNSYLNCVICMVTNTNFREGLLALLRLKAGTERSRHLCSCSCACAGEYRTAARQASPTIAHILIRSLHQAEHRSSDFKLEDSSCTDIGYVNPALKD